MKARIDKWVYGGAGIGSDEEGNPVSLSFTLPGELVEMAGDTLTILKPAPDRVAPRCPHFGACGGCHYQHAAYPAQVDLKLGILRDTLHAAGLTSLPAIQTHTAEPWGYRNRIRLRLTSIGGEVQVGYNRRGGYEFLPIRECPIAAPLLLRAAAALVSILSAKGEFAAWTSLIREIELFTNPDETALQLTLFVTADRPALLQPLCQQLQSSIPELTGAGVIVIGVSGKQERPGSTWGASGLKYAAGGHDYWVSRGSFFQVNRFLVDELVRLATTGHSGKLAWDLYAGVGLFSRALMESFDQVTAVEIAATDLAALLKGPDHRAIASTTLDFLRRAIVERDRPDLIVADPPRAGLGPEVCALLARIAAPCSAPIQMVYVSCDPQTLARDLRAMVDSGYTLSELHLVDLFPQTFHLETVVILNR